MSSRVMIIQDIKHIQMVVHLLLETQKEQLCKLYLVHKRERISPDTSKVVNRLIVDIVEELERAPRLSNKLMERFLKRHPNVSLRTLRSLVTDRYAN